MASSSSASAAAAAPIKGVLTGRATLKFVKQFGPSSSLPRFDQGLFVPKPIKGKRKRAHLEKHVDHSHDADEDDDDEDDDEDDDDDDDDVEGVPFGPKDDGKGAAWDAVAKLWLELFFEGRFGGANEACEKRREAFASKMMAAVVAALSSELRGTTFAPGACLAALVEAVYSTVYDVAKEETDAHKRAQMLRWTMPQLQADFLAHLQQQSFENVAFMMSKCAAGAIIAMNPESKQASLLFAAAASAAEYGSVLPVDMACRVLPCRRTSKGGCAGGSCASGSCADMEEVEVWLARVVSFCLLYGMACIVSRTGGFVSLGCNSAAGDPTFAHAALVARYPDFEDSFNGGCVFRVKHYSSTIGEGPRAVLARGHFLAGYDLWACAAGADGEEWAGRLPTEASTTNVLVQHSGEHDEKPAHVLPLARVDSDKMRFDKIADYDLSVYRPGYAALDGVGGPGSPFSIQSGYPASLPPSTSALIKQLTLVGNRFHEHRFTRADSVKGGASTIRQSTSLSHRAPFVLFPSLSFPPHCPMLWFPLGAHPVLSLAPPALHSLPFFCRGRERGGAGGRGRAEGPEGLAHARRGRPCGGGGHDRGRRRRRGRHGRRGREAAEGR
jgi:hypothetical protein